MPTWNVQVDCQGVMSETDVWGRDVSDAAEEAVSVFDEGTFGDGEHVEVLVQQEGSDVWVTCDVLVSKGIKYYVEVVG